MIVSCGQLTVLWITRPQEAFAAGVDVDAVVDVEVDEADDVEEGVESDLAAGAESVFAGVVEVPLAPDRLSLR